jgi:hypothetical protein
LHSAYLGASGSIWEHLEGSVWLFRVAELFGYNFQTIFHFADDYLVRPQIQKAVEHKVWKRRAIARDLKLQYQQNQIFV